MSLNGMCDPACWGLAVVGDPEGLEVAGIVTLAMLLQSINDCDALRVSEERMFLHLEFLPIYFFQEPLEMPWKRSPLLLLYLSLVKQQLWTAGN